MSVQISAGVVLFDSPLQRDSGWCSVNGEPAFAINSAQALSSGAVWIVNLEDRLFRDSGLGASKRFRSRDYLRSTLLSLAREMGVAVKTESGHQALGAGCARTLSRLFASTMDISARLGMHTFPLGQLRLGYRQSFAPEDEVLDAPLRYADVFRDACQRYAMSERRRQQRSTMYQEQTTTFTRHRYEHAVEVLAQYVPRGRWRSLPIMSAREIASHPRPLLIEAEVHNIGDPLGHLINFGGTLPNAAAGEPRRWLTQPEFVFLEPFSDIAVRSVIECESYAENPLYGALPKLTPLQQISPATLLALENLWTCGYRLPNGRSSFSPLAAWISAHDRIICVREALEIIKRDPEADVTQYGFGKVTVSTADQGANEGAWLHHITANTALLPPAAIVSPKEIDLGPDACPVEIIQAALIGGRADVLLGTDEEAIQQFDAAITPDEYDDVAA